MKRILMFLLILLIVGCKDEKKEYPKPVKTGNFIQYNKIYYCNRCNVEFENATTNANDDDVVSFEHGSFCFTNGFLQIKVDARDETYNITSVQCYKYPHSNLKYSDITMVRDGVKYKAMFTINVASYVPYQIMVERYDKEFNDYVSLYDFEYTDVDKLIKESKNDKASD